MKKLAILLPLSLGLSFASSIESLVSNAYKNNENLKSLEKSIKLSQYDISLASKWKDPVLSLGLNDIQFDEPLKRDLEPMQAQFIGFSQVVPMGDKLKIKEEIALKDKSIAKLILEDKKLILKARIYELAFSILLLEKKLKLLNSYEKNLKKQEKLLGDLYKFNKSNQNELLNLEISLVNLKLKTKAIKTSIDNLYLKLENITYEKIEKIESPLSLEKLVLNMDSILHPKIKLLELKSKRFLSVSKLEMENRKQDIKVNLTYFNRDSKYEDYANISVNIPLSIYESQKLKALKAKTAAKKEEANLKELKKNFEIQVKLFENSANLAFENYKLITKRLIPIKNKLQKSVENYNAYSGIKPQETIKNLNELISFELKAIDEKMKYFSNYSKLIYFIQKVK